MPTERRRRRESQTKLPVAIWAIIFVFVAGVGYIAGTFNNQIMAAIAPIFGYRISTDTLDLSSVQDTYQALKGNFDGTLDDQKLIEGANQGLVEAAGDEYTVYLTPTESEEFNDNLTGNIGGGIGVELGLRGGEVTILRLLRDNPAEDAGIMAGDVVTTINDESALGWTVEQAVMKIRGEVGTTVKLSIRRGGQLKEFSITRAQINNPSVYTDVVDGVGIMTITRFDDKTGSLARAAAQQFKNDGVRAVVLDLRSNGGGYVTAAQEVAGLWLDNKVVVTEKTNSKTVDTLKSGGNPLLAGLPTVVLVNGSTASASEIVAGALQDYDVATIMGEKTFGKGSVQKLITLPNGAELKVTTARWYTPNERNISQQGVTPDETVGIEQADIDAGRDPQLDAAKASFN